jgi:hypothetical protein
MAMRKLAAVTFGMLMMTLVGDQAAHAAPSRGAGAATSRTVAAPIKSADATSQSFWYFTKQLTSSTYQLTTWYVGVFAYFSHRGTDYYSDLYKEVDLCRQTSHGDRCTGESFAYGDSDLSKSGESYTVDSDDLTAAHVVARYKLQKYDENGNPIGSPVPHAIDAKWSGRGDLERNHQKYSYHQGCTHFTTTIKGKYRRATGTGMLDERDLGSTKDAFIATDASLEVDHVC